MVLIERYHYLTFFVCVCWSLHLSQNVQSFFLSDVNECQTDTDNCAANAVCANSGGSFDCTCNPEFSGDGVVCFG